MARAPVLFFLFALATVVGCVDGSGRGKTAPLVAEPVFYAKNVKAYGETALGEVPPDVVYGWDVTVVGDVARWRECSTVDTCGQVERERPAHDLIGMHHVAHAHVDGRAVEVQRLTLQPRPTYIVPNFKPATTTPTR